MSISLNLLSGRNRQPPELRERMRFLQLMAHGHGAELSRSRRWDQKECSLEAETERGFTRRRHTCNPCWVQAASVACELWFGGKEAQNEIEKSLAR